MLFMLSAFKFDHWTCKPIITIITDVGTALAEFIWLSFSEEMSFLRALSFSLVRRQTSAGWPWHCSQSSRLCPSDGSHRPGDDGNAFRRERTSSISRRLRHCSYTPLLLRLYLEVIFIIIIIIITNILKCTPIDFFDTTATNAAGHFTKGLLPYASDRLIDWLIDWSNVSNYR